MKYISDIGFSKGFPFAADDLIVRNRWVQSLMFRIHIYFNIPSYKLEIVGSHVIEFKSWVVNRSFRYLLIESPSQLL